MRSDIRILYDQSVNETHRGYPTIQTVAHTGRRGRPQILIDPDFLAWAYNRRSISALARFLQVGRTTLQNAMIAQGLFTPNSRNIDSATMPPPNTHTEEEADGSMDPQPPIPDDELLEPNLPLPDRLPDDVQQIAEGLSGTRRQHQSLHHSPISDDDLDDLIVCLRLHFRRAGIRMMDGMLRRLGYRIQYERIRHSLLRIDPVRRVFERIRIRRRTYSVAGPNALWHHDGQHGNTSF